MGLAFLITSEKLNLLSERKVLKEAEYATLLDAAGVIEQADKQAQRMIANAQRAAGDHRRRGYEQGMAEAKKESAAQIMRDADSVQRQLHALKLTMAQIVVKAMRALAGAMDMAQLMEAALERVEAVVRAEPFVQARVAPGDEVALRRAIERLQQRGVWTLQMAVVVDASLARGHCTLETASGRVQIGLDAQLDVLAKLIESA